MISEARISIVSKIYAKALLDIAIRDDNTELYKTQLDEICEVLNASEDLKIVMANSSVSVLKKIEILDSVFGGKINAKLLNFLKILVEKNRFGEMCSINSSYDEMIANLANIKTVEVLSPVKLNFENKSNVLFKLEHKLGCEVLPIWKIDESLIAGLAFKFDDTVIDTSVRAKLEDLSKNITR